MQHIAIDRPERLKSLAELRTRIGMARNDKEECEEIAIMQLLGFATRPRARRSFTAEISFRWQA